MIRWLFVVLLVMVSPLFAQEVSYSYPKYDPLSDAQKDLTAAIQSAKMQGKPILVLVGGDWCIWCRRLDSLFQRSSELLSYLQTHYIFLKINVSKENRNEKVLSRFPKIPGYPHFFVLDSSGKVIHSQSTDEFELSSNSLQKGYDKGKVLDFLRRWSVNKRKER